jgi:CBS domain containing-hemolysin-like protein
MTMVSERMIRTDRSTIRSAARVVIGLFAVLVSTAPEAQASLLSPEAEDKLATFIAIFVLFVVPVVLIVLFWMVHILPEKIAHRRHHPQFEAIRTLCLLSLVFGGLLWPLAWLWAYSKPVMYKMAYGTDKLPDALKEEYPGDAKAVDTSLHDRLARLEERVPGDALKGIRADLEALEAKFVNTEVR